MYKVDKNIHENNLTVKEKWNIIIWVLKAIRYDGTRRHAGQVFILGVSFIM